MPKCATCNRLYPPEFLKTHDDGGKQCFFCVTKSDVIQAEGAVFEKEDVVRKYHEFGKEMVDKRNVKDLVVESAVNRYAK